jgi:hypothetical protein
MVTAGLVAFSLLGCATAGPGPAEAVDAASMQARADFVACGPRRPEICTQEYVPVCGLRATGLECVTKPCDGTFERVTRSNRCTACADTEVVGWIPGACDADPVDSPLYLDP